MFKNFLTATVATLGASAVFAQAAAPAAATAAEVGFFAGILGFLTGWGVLILAVLVLFGIISEHNNARGWSVFWALLAAAIAYLVFHVSLMTLIVGAIGYIIIGLFWSFWRYKRHASKIVEEYRQSSDSEKERALRGLHPKAMLSTITAWIVIWPFSMVENVIGDLITGIQMLVTKFFRGVYHKVYDSAVAALR
jgi:hypothetical protein